MTPKSWYAVKTHQPTNQPTNCPHTAHLTKDLYEEFCWGKFFHSPYSPDHASSDYHLFRGFQNYFDGLLWTLREEDEHKLVPYFLSKYKKKLQEWHY